MRAVPPVVVEQLQFMNLALREEFLLTVHAKHLIYKLPISYSMSTISPAPQRQPKWFVCIPLYTLLVSMSGLMFDS